MGSRRRAASGVWLALALAPTCAWADSYRLAGEAADLSVTTEAVAPEGAFKASSQILVQPHLAPDLDARLAFSIATGARADAAPVWAGVTPLPPLSWSRAGLNVQAGWTAGSGAKLELQAGDEVRTQTFLGPLTLDSRPTSVNDSQTARVGVATPLTARTSLTVSGGVGSDTGAVDLVEGASLVRRVALRGDRSDVAVQLDWKPDPALSLQIGERLERRSLAWGDAGLADGFVEAQPRAAAVLKPIPGSEWSLSLERVVAPLDAAKFANLAQTAEQTGAAQGAVRLRPDSAWRVKAGIAHRFHRTGAVSLAFTVADLESSTELVRIAPGVQGPGSVAGGGRRQWDLSLTLPLALVGLDALSLQGAGLWRHSAIPDPITGAMRPPSGETPYEAKLSLVADLPGRDLRVGVQSQASGASAVYGVARVDEISVSPALGAFVEYRPSAFALRLQLDNLAGADRRYLTTQYAVSRDTGPAEEIDRRVSGGAGFTLSLRKTL